MSDVLGDPKRRQQLGPVLDQLGEFAREVGWAFGARVVGSSRDGRQLGVAEPRGRPPPSTTMCSSYRNACLVVTRTGVRVRVFRPDVAAGVSKAARPSNNSTKHGLPK